MICVYTDHYNGINLYTNDVSVIQYKDDIYQFGNKPALTHFQKLSAYRKPGKKEL